MFVTGLRVSFRNCQLGWMQFVLSFAKKTFRPKNRHRELSTTFVLLLPLTKPEGASTIVLGDQWQSKGLFTQSDRLCSTTKK
jgi:hypothetical protein